MLPGQPYAGPVAEMHIEARLSVGLSPVARKVLIEALASANIRKTIDDLTAITLRDFAAATDRLEVNKQDRDTATFQEIAESVLAGDGTLTTAGSVTGPPWWATNHAKALAAWLAVLLTLLGVALQVYQVAHGAGPPQIHIQIVQIGGPASP